MNYLKSMTAQEVFDKVVTHLVNQRVPSMLEDDRDTCAYRGSSGLMCAAGCLIPDENYNPDFENCSWKSLIDQGLVPDDHAQLISDLQWQHDNNNCFDSMFMRMRFKTVANEHKLDTSILQKLPFNDEL